VVSVFAIVLLAAAVALLLAAELPRLGLKPRRMPQHRLRTRRKPHLRVVRDDESDEFARAVERDLANLPTYDPREKRNSKN
jgi:hypothetical protein